MQLQDLSYRLNNQVLPLCDEKNGVHAKVSVEVVSLENVYTVEEGTYVKSGNEYRSGNIVWGDTERVDGSVRLAIDDTPDGKSFSVQAKLDKNVRCVKLRFEDLPMGKLISRSAEDKEVTEYGLLYHYPEGWRDLSYPLLLFALDDGRYMYIRCLDKTVNLKRFYIKKTATGMRVDVVQEQNGTRISPTYDVPTVEYGIVADKETVFDRQSEFMKQTYGLYEFENSPIVPKWMKDISLVVIMHMEAFTGHIFHTYEDAYNDVKKLTELIDGKRILVYFAGWEGRYYYKYGEYTPDDRLGGAEELKECIDKIHALGCKTMAMYGINIVNKNQPEIKKIIGEAEFEGVSGARFHSGSVNWEGAHHYDFNELIQFNIASKAWQDNLFGQIKNVTDTFGFDGAFLDIAAHFVNDKHNSLYEGVVAFCDRLRTIKEDFLVSGEGYYDGLSRAMPLFQSGHTDGSLHYHDRVSEKLFTKYSREFAHLCLGDLSRGSSGVHELGENTEKTTPLRKGIIPTIALVEDTIEKAYEQVKEVAEQAKEYARRFLNEGEDE